MKIGLILTAFLMAVIFSSACGGGKIATEFPTPTTKSETSPTPEATSSSQGHFNAGDALKREGRFEEAIAQYNEAIRLEPQDAQAHNNRGTTYLRLGQVERAIQDLDEAIRIDPQYAQPYSNRGVAYASLGQLERAIMDFDEAIQLEPQHAAAHNNRG